MPVFWKHLSPQYVPNNFECPQALLQGILNKKDIWHKTYMVCTEFCEVLYHLLIMMLMLLKCYVQEYTSSECGQCASVQERAVCKCGRVHEWAVCKCTSVQVYKCASVSSVQVCKSAFAACQRSSFLDLELAGWINHLLSCFTVSVERS